jgi:chemotaxis protein methyltransferase CheR
MALLCGRLSRRLRALGMSRMEEYYALVAQAAQADEREAMIDAITTNETRFFREPKHFEFLEHRAIPRWLDEAREGLRPKTIRIWSAGCSSGEEPYSLAMLMAANLLSNAVWSASVLATDISNRMLERARCGIYDVAKSADIPQRLLKSFMLKGIGREKGQMKVMPVLQDLVSFRKLNLSHDPYPPQAHFDVIFCRNVLIYFDLESKQKVVHRLANCLAVGGLLFLGHAENLSGMNSPFRSLAPAIYVRAGEGLGF